MSEGMVQVQVPPRIVPYSPMSSVSPTPLPNGPAPRIPLPNGNIPPGGSN